MGELLLRKNEFSLDPVGIPQVRAELRVVGLQCQSSVANIIGTKDTVMSTPAKMLLRVSARRLSIWARIHVVIISRRALAHGFLLSLLVLLYVPAPSKP